MQDCDGKAAAGAMRRLTRQRLSCSGQPVRGPSWKEKTSTCVVCVSDRATPPEVQLRLSPIARSLLHG